MKRDISVLKIYMNMLADGSAFSNWENPPDAKTRAILVEHLMKGKNIGGGVSLDMTKIRKVITESKDTEDLKRMMDEMRITEDEFLV